MYKSVSMSSIKRRVNGEMVVFHEVVINAETENVTIYWFESPAEAAAFYQSFFKS